MASRRKILLVEQNCQPSAYLALALGGMKATALADERIASEADFGITQFAHDETPRGMANTILRDPPDVLACSVLGWSFRRLSALAEAYRAVRPDGWIIWGGTHVTNQAERVFRVCPGVDVVVNGEGELTFVELIRAFLAGESPRALHGIQGVSFRDAAGGVVTTDARPRIMDLSVLPSPLTTGALPLRGADGNALYDVILLETNRGCPYRCSFCYWGAAIGQKVRRFPRERLREELEVLAHERVEKVVLCDANFGMLPEDAEFAEDFIRARDKHGYPQQLDGNWAKNKSKTFYAIAERMQETGIQGVFTLALQTLTEDALESMHRRNMRINDWESLVEWLREGGFSFYAELIWGAPGDTPEDFIAGYDRLARQIHHLSIYPMLILPNTDYDENREAHGLRTVRDDEHDYEYVLAHRTMTIEDNLRMQRFLFWARVVGENIYFRYIFQPLRALLGLTQSQAMLELADFIDAHPDPAADPLRTEGIEVVTQGPVAAAVHYLYTDAAAARLLQEWWDERVLPRAEERHRAFLEDVFRYERYARPLFLAGGRVPDGLDRIDVGEQTYYVRRDEHFDYDVAGIVAAMRDSDDVAIETDPAQVEFRSLEGFERVYHNHRTAEHYTARVTRAPLPAREPVTA